MASAFINRPWTAGLTGVAAVSALFIVLLAAMHAIGSDRAGSVGSPRIDLPKQHLTIYCGRSESLVGEVIARFERETGIPVRVKYAGTGPLAALVLEEAHRTPADVFYAQDPGGLGVVAEAGRLAELPEHLLDRVGYSYRDPLGRWVGVTGRLRTIAYSAERVEAAQLPVSVMELTDPRWRGRIGWAPSNASFQAFVTAMRHQHGENVTERWLRDMIANDVRVFANNSSILQAIADGEVDLGLTNHYYAHRMAHENNNGRRGFPVANHVPAGSEGEGDICGAMLVSGAAVLETAGNREAAERFIEFLLSDSVQQYFAERTFEYPLANGSQPSDGVPALDAVPARSIDLNQLGDLRETVGLLRRVGALR